MKRAISQEEVMLQKIIYCFLVIATVCFLLSAQSLTGADYQDIIPPSIGRMVKLANAETEDAPTRPVLTVTPREIELGALGPEETISGEFLLKNLTTGYLTWSISCPEGWEQSSGVKTIQGAVAGVSETLRLQAQAADSGENVSGDKAKSSSYYASLKLLAGSRELECRKLLKSGQNRTAIRISSTGGQRNIFVNFRIPSSQGLPAVHLDPQRLDFGVQASGKVASKKIALTNKGKEMLKWSVFPGVVSKKEPFAELSSESPKERYFSFHAEALPLPGKYLIPDHLKSSLELIGQWGEKNGYPVSKSVPASLKFRFSGKGLSLFLQSHLKEGNCTIYLNDEVLKLPDVLSGEWEKKELLVAEGLADGPHVVTIVIREGSLEVEGMKVLGKEVIRGPRGWIAVYPNSGTTLTETDYLNVRVDTSNLAPGYYTDQILFKTNAGEEKAEIFVDVVHDFSHKNIDVYLYSKDLDYLLTADPQAESQRIIQNGYLKEGIAFRLFSPETPGTKSFYRWYHPARKDHFYSYERSGGGKALDGYVFEGALGNIATSRMTNTRELYRWFNPTTGRHYYSTKLTPAKKSYRYDGIAGYVR